MNNESPSKFYKYKLMFSYSTSKNQHMTSLNISIKEMKLSDIFFKQSCLFDIKISGEVKFQEFDVNESKLLSNANLSWPLIRAF